MNDPAPPTLPLPEAAGIVPATGAMRNDCCESSGSSGSRCSRKNRGNAYCRWRARDVPEFDDLPGSGYKPTLLVELADGAVPGISFERTPERMRRPQTRISGTHERTIPPPRNIKRVQHLSHRFLTKNCPCRARTHGKRGTWHFMPG
jgi:hypothetical protein